MELEQPVMAEELVKEKTVAGKVRVAVPGVMPVAPRVIWKVYCTFWLIMLLAGLMVRVWG